MLERRRAEGKSVPSLDSKPSIPPWCQIAWDAFVDLSAARYYTQQWALPITFSDILAWLEINDISFQEDREFITRCVRELDREWVVLSHKEVLRTMKNR